LRFFREITKFTKESENSICYAGEGWDLFFVGLFSVTGQLTPVILIEVTTVFETFPELGSCSMKPDFNGIERYLQDFGNLLIGESFKFIEDDAGTFISIQSNPLACFGLRLLIVVVVRGVLRMKSLRWWGG
jgi:hypothetical protein